MSFVDARRTTLIVDGPKFTSPLPRREETGEKTCNDCEETKSVEEFGWVTISSKNPYRKRANRCRECAARWRREDRKKKPDVYRAQNKRYASKSPKRRRDYFLRKTYGISLEEYEALAESQMGRCAICGEKPSGEGNNKVLHVDHCHETGNNRELLCSKCNTGIGQFMEDVEVMKKAIAYLERHQS